MKDQPRNLGLDLVRVTEAAALAAGRWLGRGRYKEANQAASDAMFAALNTMEIDGVIVVGEEQRLDWLSSLDSGQTVGTGKGPKVDIVVDPVDGTRLLVAGRSGALSVVGMAPRGTMWSPVAAYMEKIVVDRDVARHLVPEVMDAPAAWTLALIARHKDKPIEDLTVFVLDRKRHLDLIDEIRAAGAMVRLRTDGDIVGSLLAATPRSGIDALMGVGGVSEGVVAACAIKAMEGRMLSRLAPQSDEEIRSIAAQNFDRHRILNSDELVNSDTIFFAATGVSDGPFLKGVRYHRDQAETHSLLLRAETGTRRTIVSEHSLKRLFALS